MKLHFLGTGAADWNIKKATTDKNFRRFSSLLIDDCLLVDPGPCIFEFAESFGYGEALFENVQDIIKTHEHSDHVCAESIENIKKAKLWECSASQTFETANHIISSYPANHLTAENPKHYVIESKIDEKRIFYGCDGAWLFYPVFHELKKQRFDAMIFDCTLGDIHGDYRIFEHNSLPMVMELSAAFSNVCNNFMISHMARTLHTTHNELEDKLKDTNITVCYDNMVCFV